MVLLAARQKWINLFKLFWNNLKLWIQLVHLAYTFNNATSAQNLLVDWKKEEAGIKSNAIISNHRKLWLDTWGQKKTKPSVTS